MSEWFTAAGTPANRGSLLSLPIRTQLAQIGTAFAKLPDFTSNASKLLAFNSGATAVEAVTSLALSIAFTKTDAVDLTDNGNALNVGTLAGAHLAFSPAIIQAKAAAASSAALSINQFGGNVSIGAQSNTGTVLLYHNAANVLKTAVASVGVGNATGINTAGWGAALTISAAASANAALELVMDTTLAGYISYSQSGGSLLGFNLYAYANIPLVMGANNTERIRIAADGRIALGSGGIATAVDVAVRGTTNDSSQYALGVYASNGDGLLVVRNDGLINSGDEANSPYNLTTASAANLNIASGGNFARSTSSIKYKIDVETATGSLDKVMALRPVKFRSKSAHDGNRMFGGLIAEEVHAAGLGEYVEYNKDNEPDGVMYSHLVALAFGAIQELSAAIAALANKVDAKK